MPLWRGAAVEVSARVVGILGMHRSGTSCLTGSLQEAGLFLGDCHTWNPHNLKGNRENQQFVDLHDLILAANGGAWDRPPKAVTWGEGHIARARELLAAHAADSIFGFKDPRTLLVLKGWKAVCPYMEFVGIFRHPDAVAQSLEKRSAMARDEALSLWYAYNSALYREYRQKPFPLFNFDDDESELDEKIFRVASEMGMSGRSGGEKFYSSELKSNAASDSLTLPWKIRRLYKKLKKVGL